MTEIETGNGEVALTLKRKRIMIYFIEATEKLIRSDGVEGLSIRKIASEAAITAPRSIIILKIWSISCYSARFATCVNISYFWVSL